MDNQQKEESTLRAGAWEGLEGGGLVACFPVTICFFMLGPLGSNAPVGVIIHYMASYGLMGFMGGFSLGFIIGVIKAEIKKRGRE